MTNAIIHVAECVKCGANTELHATLSHHVGGTIITLCPDCFERAKKYHAGGKCTCCNGELGEETK